MGGVFLLLDNWYGYGLYRQHACALNVDQTQMIYKAFITSLKLD